MLFIERSINFVSYFVELSGLFVCTPMDLLLVQWILAMSLVSNDVSQPLSRLWSIPCSSDCIRSFSSGFEGLYTYMFVCVINYNYVNLCTL